MMPGETALTRMPRQAYSMARDRVAAVPPRHLGDGPLGHQEEPGQIDPDDPGVVVRRVLGERLGDVHTGVVDERVDATEPVQRRAYDPVGGRGLGDVPTHGEHARVLGRPDRAGAGHHRPALPAVPGHQPGADALRASGDNGYLSTHGQRAAGAGSFGWGERGVTPSTIMV